MDKEDLKRLASNLHLVVCRKSHISGEDFCEWYIESRLNTQWEEPEHKRWIDLAESFVETTGISSLDKMYRILKICGDLVMEVPNHSVEVKDFIVTVISRAFGH